MVRITMVLILAILSMETLASPLNLEVSVKVVQNGNTTDQSAESCLPDGHACGFKQKDSCCKGLRCVDVGRNGYKDVCQSWLCICMS